MTVTAIDLLHDRVVAAAGDESPALLAVLAQARTGAQRLAGQGALDAAGEAFSGVALAALSATGRVGPAAIGELLQDAHDLTQAEPLTAVLLALNDPTTLQESLAVALHAHVTLIAAATGLVEVAAWRVVPDGAMIPAASSAPSAFEATRPIVAKAFCRSDAELSLVVVEADDEPCAVIAWVPLASGIDHARLLAERAATALAIAVERAELAQTEVAHHAGVARGARRRLARVAFDLHDGPLQDLALIRQELARLRSRLAAVGIDAAAGPLDDVIAIAESTETELRELATSMMSSNLVQRPFDEALQSVARGFALRSGLEPQVTVAGDVHALTSMERVALLRVVSEALANVREHSGAQRVGLSVTVRETDIEAVIEDDGCGFDLQRTLPEAARRGSLGLLGMMERVRLMNGSWDVQSGVGDGTRIVVRLDRFFPSRQFEGVRPAA